MNATKFLPSVEHIRKRVLDDDDDDDNDEEELRNVTLYIQHQSRVHQMNLS